MIITIDGPAGSGKSTAARLLAERLGFFHLDTGAIYRSIAYLTKKNGIPLNDERGIVDIASGIDIDFVIQDKVKKVIANGEDVTEKIRMPEISNAASDVAKIAGVRSALIDIQRRFAEGRNIVAEGRDMGTVIFPYADLKFFLNASPRVRAKRRELELRLKGIDESFSKVLEDIERRDIQDSQRDVAPLRPANDAIMVDTDNMNIEEVLEFLLSEVKRRWK
ncbi:MAG: (d)CMP kinase [Deltaproteobacteria bacterium]|nr:(d)CMP kinase [Deltaproteobacteria bacterium]